MKSIRKLAQLLKPYTVWAILAPLLMLLEVTMDLVQPWVIERIIDDGVAKQNAAFIINAGLGLIVVALIGIVGGIGCSIFTVKAAQGVYTLWNGVFGDINGTSVPADYDGDGKADFAVYYRDTGLW